MSRWSSSPKETPKQQGLAPIWQGVGFIVLVVLTVGGYWGAGELIRLNAQKPFLPFAVPYGYSVHLFGPLYMPAQTVVQLGFMFVLDLLAYALMTIVYGIANPIKPGEKDAPPEYRGRRR